METLNNNGKKLDVLAEKTVTAVLDNTEVSFSPAPDEISDDDFLNAVHGDGDKEAAHATVVSLLSGVSVVTKKILKPFTVVNSCVLETQDTDDPVKIVESTFSQLKEIRNNIKRCQALAQKSEEEAKAAAAKPVGFWHSTTPALEALQTTCKHFAEALVQTAATQKLLFKQQEVTAKAVAALIRLSAGNIAMTRLIVDSVKTKLQQASEQTISPESREELKKLLLQLTQQLDQMEQIERLKTRIDSLKTNQRTLVQKQEERFDGYKNLVDQQLESLQMTVHNLESMQVKCDDFNDLRKLVALLEKRQSEQNEVFKRWENKRFGLFWFSVVGIIAGFGSIGIVLFLLLK